MVNEELRQKLQEQFNQSMNKIYNKNLLKEQNIECKEEMTIEDIFLDYPILSKDESPFQLTEKEKIELEKREKEKEEIRKKMQLQFDIAMKEKYLTEMKDNESVIKAEKIKRKKEREKLTKKLRYQVIQRDGGKCVICGRGVEDGVKLHVDHIIPIAKGGKTEINNLRTLCSDCNEGKRDKYDVWGWN